VDDPKSKSWRAGLSAPLAFSLNQAAALCGIPVPQLSEWTDCGYVRAEGAGDERRYGRDALRQILRVRDAMRSDRAPTRGTAHTAVSRRRREPGRTPPEARRPEEFSDSASPMNDVRLTLHAEIYFALNSDAPRTVEHLAAQLGVDARQMERILDSMTTGGVVRVVQDGLLCYGTGRARLRGPSPREQRIRATRRPRIPSPRQ
jgi:hypothetical protein